MSTQAATIEVADEQVKQEALAVVDEAKAITITNDDDYATAGQFLRERIKAVRAEIEDVFGPAVKAAHEAHRAALAARKKVEAPLLEAERIVKGSMGAYHREREQERRRLEAEQRRAAREKAEQEALERAAELENQGRIEEAEALIEAPPAMAVVPEPEVAKPQADGVSVRTVWRFRIVDSAAIKAAYVTPDEKKIGQVVRAMGADAAELVGGIEVYQEEIVSARS